jgi:uncharacterized membrane protein
MEEFLHLQNNRMNRKTTLFLLLLPAVIFALILSFLLGKANLNVITGIPKIDILGIQDSK